MLRRRLHQLKAEIARRLERHQVGKLLTTIEGIGPQTAACIIAELRRRYSSAYVDGFLASGNSFFLSPQHRLRERVNSKDYRFARSLKTTAGASFSDSV